MGGMFSKPKAPDTSRQEAALAAQDLKIKQQEEETKKRDAAAMNARRARTSARQSLLTGDETGVGRQTLG
jgi:hypothetical protein